MAMAQPITPNYGANPNLNMALAQATGYTGNFGGGQYQDWLKTQPVATQQANQQIMNQTGVVPVTVEPLHQWEKTGLTSMANRQTPAGMTEAMTRLRELIDNPQAFAAQYTNPMATQFIQGAQSGVQAGTAPITQSDIDAYMNPYTKNVIDASINRLSESAQRARAALTATEGQRGARSFGDTATGVRLGELDKELLSKEGDLASSYGYQGYNDAVNRVAADRARSLSGAQLSGNLAGTAQGLTSSALGLGGSSVGGLADLSGYISNYERGAAQDAVDAGEYVRTYNQAINDMIGNDMLAEQSYDPAKISQLLNWLQSFQSGTGGAQPGANSLQNLATIGGKAGGLLEVLGGVGNISGGYGFDFSGGGAGNDMLGL